MKTCNHFNIVNDRAVSLIKDKPNHNYICSECLHQFTVNEYYYMREYCDLLNILNDCNKNRWNLGKECAMPRLQELKAYIPKPVSYEDSTY